METGRKKDVVLVVGGSGYLGLHVLEALAASPSDYTIAFTYQSHPPSPELLQKLPNVLVFQLDLCSGIGLAEISKALDNVGSGCGGAQPLVVINCAAISVPRACEQDPEAAMAINVPHTIVQWLNSLNASLRPFLIHLSTDQVYGGVKSFYKEDDKTTPVNVYGKSKVAAESYVISNYSNYAILRSSIIYGPQPFVPVPKTLPLQWIDGVLSGGAAGEFFDDEYRCPVYVKDVVRAIELCITKRTSVGQNLQLLLNLGGPNRLSRADMADSVASVRGYDKKLVKRVSALSVNRGVPSPADISMDVSKVVKVLGITLTDFTTGVAQTLNSKSNEI